MKQLSEVQIDYALKSTLSQWRREGDFICRDFEFDDFITAWGFMSKVGNACSRLARRRNTRVPVSACVISSADRRANATLVTPFKSRLSTAARVATLDTSVANTRR